MSSSGKSNLSGSSAGGLLEPGPDMAEPEQPGMPEPEILEDNEDAVAEDHFQSLEETAEKYGLDGDYDFVTEDYLDEGAVAATAKVPGMEIDMVETYEDLKDSKLAFTDENGNIYSVNQKDQIGFIADSEIYPELDSETTEHVDLHELQHLTQYDEDTLWGDALKDEYNLSEEMTFQLNYIDRLMDMSEDPLLGNLVDDAQVTALVEGYTQRVTEAIQENGREVGENFYPGYTQLAENIMMQEFGTDPNKEFDPDLNPEDY